MLEGAPQQTRQNLIISNSYLNVLLLQNIFVVDKPNESCRRYKGWIFQVSVFQNSTTYRTHNKC